MLFETSPPRYLSAVVAVLAVVFLTGAGKSKSRVQRRIKERSAKPKSSVSAMKRAKNYVGLGDHYAMTGTGELLSAGQTGRP